MTLATSTLADRLHAVRDALSAYVGLEVDEIPGAPPETGGAPSRDGLAGLVRQCGLSPFERDTLVMAAGIELDQSLAELCARALGDPARRYATFGLALRAIDGGHWDAVSADGPLRALALVDVDRRTGGLTEARLVVDDRILLALLGLDSVDERLSEVADAEAPDGSVLPARHQDLMEQAALRWGDSGVAGPLLVRGPAAARACFVRALTHALGAPRLWRLAVNNVPGDPADQLTVLRRLTREARLTGSPIVLDFADADTGVLMVARRFAHRLARLAVPVVLSSPDPVSDLPAGMAIVDLPDVTLAEQVALWNQALGPVAMDMNGHVEHMAGQFRLPAEQLRAAVSDVSPVTDPAALTAELWEACRKRARADLDGLAARIVPTARWDDLVLPAREVSSLQDLLRHARHRALVHEHWQVTGASRHGAGVTALFTGPSGTGKSLAAEVIAAELDVDLYRVDLSQVVSKYIGETEKNLRRVFDAAEQSGAVLVIDEADALFGQRSEVKDSHDRYANIEVSYLLQRMESYRGLAVLTTNLRSNIDDAFVRRLGFIVTFPFPEQPQRQALWERAFSRRVPVESLQPTQLAQLNLSGGSIRNVAVHAAFLAAERGSPVTMADILRGARSEYDKLERPLTPTELAGWPR